MRTRWLAGALGVVAVLAAASAVGSTFAAGWTFTDALEGFVVSNIVIGLSFGLCGVLIAWHRQTSPLGWMYAGGGLCQTLSALAAPLGEVLNDRGAAVWLLRLDVTVFQWAWPVNITLIPISLLLLPDGQLASRRWRPVAIVVAVTAPLFVLEVGLSPESPPGLPPAYGTISPGTYDSLAWLWTVSEVRWALSVLVGVVCLVVRYRAGSEMVRRQLLWLVAAAAVIVVAVTPWALVAGTPLVVLFTIPLLPAAVAAAVLRHQLLDIRLVVARGLTYALLSALVLAAYAALVVVLSGVASALLVALLALPLRSRLQSAVDQLLYGERSNPLRVASRVGRSLGVGLPETLEEIRATLRLPYVGVVVRGDEIAAAGALDGPSASLPLQGGNLIIGLRTGETRLAPAAARAAVRPHRNRGTRHRPPGGAAALAGAARGRPGARAPQTTPRVARRARTAVDRRRALRRHSSQPGRRRTGGRTTAAALGRPERTRSAIQEVRRIVDDLGTPALDELGLVEALRIRADQLHYRSDGQPLNTTVEATDLPPLPAAVEQVVYRIATEALTNVVRHSRASSAVVRLCCDDAGLHCDVLDDGGRTGPWTPGIGIVGMRERVAELGGTCEAGPGPQGGQVRVCMPTVLA